MKIKESISLDLTGANSLLKRTGIALCLVSAATCLPGLGQSDIGNRFLKNWPKQTQASGTGFNCQMGETPDGMGNSRLLIKSLIEPSNLSVGCKINLKLNQGRGSSAPHYEISKNDGTPEDLFYCEQAIWEASPFRLMTANSHGNLELEQSSGESNYNSSELFFRKHPMLVGKVVILHVIPPSIRLRDRFPTAFSVAELNDLCNLQAIRIANLNNPMLENFRVDWCNYIEKNQHNRISRESLLDFAASLLTKYQDLFSNVAHGAPSRRI